jgi:protein gp37
MAETAIEWATHVWNPITGCDRVSPGCAHCYALELAPRLRRFALGRQRKALEAGEPHTPGKWLNVRDGGKTSGPAFGLTLHPDVLDQPLRWTKPRTIFVNSMSDLFHEEVPDEYIARVFAVMASAHWHTFQVLTKRPERMHFLLTSDRFVLDVARGVTAETLLPIDWPLPNVWAGTSIENRRFVHRAYLLRATPAAVRFISAEPLLGPLYASDKGEIRTDYGTGREGYAYWEDGRPVDDEHAELDLGGIDWLIAGGESGPKHRPIRTEWVRQLRDACATTGTAFFFKQWGGQTPKAGGRELDGRTWDQLPTRQDIEAAHAAVTANDEEAPR